jgi:hypothetical protein
MGGKPATVPATVRKKLPWEKLPGDKLINLLISGFSIAPSAFFTDQETS